MKTIRRINRPIKFFGLTSGQFAVFVIIVALIIIACIFKRVHPIIIVCVLSSILYGSNILFQGLKREHKAGNPDYLTSLSVKSVTPSKIIDKNQVFNLIMKDK